MNPSAEPQRLSAAGQNILTGLTVFQFVSAASAALYVVTALLPGQSEATLSLPRTLALAFGGVQVLLAALYILLAQWAKGWLNEVRRWAAREGGVDQAALARKTRTLARATVFWQWLPLVALLVGVPLAWFAIGRLDPRVLQGAGAATSQVSPAQLGAIAQISVVLSLLFFGAPTVIINWAILGWIRRWMNGVSDAAAGRLPRETRLPELARTLAGWFTFVQVLLALSGLVLLTVPWLPTPQNASALLSRLNLLLSLVNTAVLLALLQWSKTFLAGVTRRAAGEAGRA